MSKQSFDFAQMLSPVTAQAFLQVNWEQKPLHLSRRDPAYYKQLASIEDLEEIIADPQTRYPAVQLSKGGTYFPHEVFSDDTKFNTDLYTGVLNLPKINAEYRAGATVVMPALHRTWAPLADLCKRIESEFNHVAHANAYLTPGNTAGFMPHYDTHEVFVLQIAGKKHWRVYEPPLELPHRKQPFNPIGYSLPAKPLLEIDLEPGDLLYLPRGHVHTTTTSNGNCAHITIGMAVYTWIDLAGELLQSAMTLPRFRTALPPGFGQAGSRDVLRAELAAVLDDLCKTASANQLIDAFLTRLQATRTTDREGFRADVIVIQPDTLLQSPEPSEYRFVAVGTKVAVEFQHRRFILQGESQATLEGMRKLHVFRAIDLPGPLPMDAKLTLVRTLFDKGFLSTP